MRRGYFDRLSFSERELCSLGVIRFSMIYSMMIVIFSRVS